MLATHAAVFAGASLLALIGVDGLSQRVQEIEIATTATAATTTTTTTASERTSLISQCIQQLKRSEKIFSGRFSDYSEFQGLGKSFKFEAKLKVHIHLLSQVRNRII